MNHPFGSLRQKISDKRELVQKMQDAVTFLKMAPESLRLVRAHKGALLSDAGEREAYARSAARLGVLIDDLNMGEHSETWENHLLGRPLGSSGEEIMTKLHGEIRDALKAIEESSSFEHDSGSSSYSDFTDSGTDSDSDTDDDDETFSSS